MKKRLNTIGISLMIGLTSATLSAAFPVESEETTLSADASLLSQYQLALTTDDSSLVKHIQTSYLDIGGDIHILWTAMTTAMKKAFFAGNIDALERIKKNALEANIGFGNIDDLGEHFFKYGSGLGGWDQLIKDVRANQIK